ncbi:MAG: hypothetical protein F6K26_36240 [Moorea sp. SIO2I5]|nr:hypothetical protein [Moorena sp. SIO2I5]
MGFPFFSHCTKASVSDDVGLIEMLSDNIDYFKSKPVNIGGKTNRALVTFERELIEILEQVGESSQTVEPLVTKSA